MTVMTVFNLIAAIVVVAGLAAICRTGYVVAGWGHEEPAASETAGSRELKRAA